MTTEYVHKVNGKPIGESLDVYMSGRGFCLVRAEISREEQVCNSSIFSSWAGGVNTIFHQRNLASPGDPGVIKPNVDTLYSRVVLDLSESDVVLTVPNITDGR